MLQTVNCVIADQDIYCDQKFVLDSMCSALIAFNKFFFWYHWKSFIVGAFDFQARLKRAELQRDRARAAFVAAKLRQQGKIKSRRYESLLWLVCSLNVITVNVLYCSSIILIDIFIVLSKCNIISCAISELLQKIYEGVVWFDFN